MMAIASCGLMFNIIMSRVLAYNPVPNAVEGKTMKDIEQEANPDEGLETPLLGKGRTTMITLLSMRRISTYWGI